MRPLLFIFTILVLLFSCQGEKSTSSDSKPVEKKEFSKEPFELVCISRIDTTGGTKKEMRQVHLESKDLREPAFVIEITNCIYLSKEDFEEYDLPADTDHAITGKTVDQKEIVVRVFKEAPGVAITQRGFISEDGWKYDPYKKYELSGDGGYKMTAMTMITSNH